MQFLNFLMVISILIDWFIYCLMNSNSTGCSKIVHIILLPWYLILSFIPPTGENITTLHNQYDLFVGEGFQKWTGWILGWLRPYKNKLSKFVLCRFRPTSLSYGFLQKLNNVGFRQYFSFGRLFKFNCICMCKATHLQKPLHKTMKIFGMITQTSFNRHTLVKSYLSFSICNFSMVRPKIKLLFWFLPFPLLFSKLTLILY